MTSMLERLKSEICRLLKDECNGGQYAVAFSGGPDSTALLSALARIYNGRVAAFHVDHQARDAESCEEECQTVDEICETLGVPCLRRKLRPSQACSENDMRKARYDCLIQMAKENNCGIVFLAHHKRDRVESVLMNLLRGCGLRGLTPMPESFVREGVVFARPMMAVHPEQIAEYLSDSGLHSFQDPSNRGDDFTRNAIRNRVVPILDEIRPGWENRIFDASVEAGDWLDWQGGEFDRHFSGIEWSHPREGEQSFPLGPLLSVHPALRKEWILRTLRTLAGGADAISAELVNEVSQFTQECRPVPFSKMLPGSWRLSLRKHEWIVKKHEQ